MDSYVKYQMTEETIGSWSRGLIPQDGRYPPEIDTGAPLVQTSIPSLLVRLLALCRSVCTRDKSAQPNEKPVLVACDVSQGIRGLVLSDF